MVKRTTEQARPVAGSGSSMQANNAQSNNSSQQEARLNPVDKDNVKNILEMFGERWDRAYVQKIYLLNNKDFEKTLEMFITENLPP